MLDSQPASSTLKRPVADSEPLIQVRDLVRRRGQTLAVDNVSFQVDRGEIFGLLGPNGAGKTSTIEVLEGLEKPTSGRVLVLRHDPYDRSGGGAPDHPSRRIGVQLQTTGLPRYLTVAETVTLFASFYDRERSMVVDGLITRLGLGGVRTRLNHRLSGGERQRLALALALVNDPEILFLDEPSAGLDPHARRELWEIIREWRSAGKTVFLTTHDMHEAEALCDSVAIMHQGRLVALDSVAALVAAAGIEQAIWLEANGRALPADIASLVPGVTRAVPETDGVLIYTADPMGAVGRLLELRRLGDLAFSSFQLRAASLEDVFLAKTGQRLRA